MRAAGLDLCPTRSEIFPYIEAMLSPSCHLQTCFRSVCIQPLSSVSESRFQMSIQALPLDEKLECLSYEETRDIVPSENGVDLSKAFDGWGRGGKTSTETVRIAADSFLNRLETGLYAFKHLKGRLVSVKVNKSNLTLTMDVYDSEQRAYERGTTLHEISNIRKLFSFLQENSKWLTGDVYGSCRGRYAVLPKGFVTLCPKRQLTRIVQDDVPLDKFIYRRERSFLLIFPRGTYTEKDLWNLEYVIKCLKENDEEYFHKQFRILKMLEWHKIFKRCEKHKFSLMCRKKRIKVITT